MEKDKIDKNKMEKDSLSGSEIKKSKIENDNSRKERDYLERLQRLQAEFENFRKRTEKERLETLRNANEDLIIKLLSVLDNFELALKNINDKGVSMIYSELHSILEKEGLKTINTKGKFDPKNHEALIQEAGKEDEKILEEIQKGYTLNDKVIRVSKVKISRIMENKDE
ncbi:MAG: nucleotide exchange factor GrpE [Nanoarchaeota archaeon]|nr:nucleotide exchange factor GrpE [Nanoarchaeota archaeon]